MYVYTDMTGPQPVKFSAHDMTRWASNDYIVLGADAGAEDDND